jgi:predicted acyl esterase
MTLTTQPSTFAHKGSYSAVPRRRHTDRVTFTHRFTEDTEITGSMALTLWISADEGTDLDVFVVVRKHNPAGAVVPFYGYNGYANDSVAKGWLRGSHRELDETRSRPERPFHAHHVVEPLDTGEPTRMTIEIWPSSTHFEADSELVVEIVGHDANRYPVLRHKAAINRGTQTVHTGGTTPSVLVIPVIPAPTSASQPATDE